MKRVALAFISCVLFFCAAVSFATETTDYSFLDGMTLEQLENFQREVSKRITAAKTAQAENDPTDLGMWKLYYYYDEFQLPTDEAYIKGYAAGNFSNSAVTDKSLTVNFLIDKENVRLQLLEYGDRVVKNYSSSRYKTYYVSMMDNNGEKYDFLGSYEPNGDKMRFDDAGEIIILNALSQNGTVRFSIKEPNGGDSYFCLIRDTSYFTNAYNALMAK